MPLYEYECDQCQQALTILQGMNDPTPECPECGGPLRKLISKSDFHLKGMGWARDGYTKEKL